jgi:hypothetical protein
VAGFYNQVMAPTLDEILNRFHQQTQTLVRSTRSGMGFFARLYMFLCWMGCRHVRTATECDLETVSGPLSSRSVAGAMASGSACHKPRCCFAMIPQCQPRYPPSLQLGPGAHLSRSPLTHSHKDYQIAHVDLIKVQHVNLLWKFRNSLLHAVYDPGGHDLRGGVEPYYVGDISTHTWRLVIPEEFLRNLVTASIQSLLAFCAREGRDPQAHLGKELWV